MDPSKFGDSNHKSEIAVALFKFELFVGWKPFNDTQALFQLKLLKHFSPAHSQFSNDIIKTLCKELLTASPDTVKEVIEGFQSVPKDQFGHYSYIPDMLSRLSNQDTKFETWWQLFS